MLTREGQMSLWHIKLLIVPGEPVGAADSAPSVLSLLDMSFLMRLSGWCFVRHVYLLCLIVALCIHLFLCLSSVHVKVYIRVHNIV